MSSILARPDLSNLLPLPAPLPTVTMDPLAASVLESLPSRELRHALEIGCGTGALTRALAMSCDSLLAIDRTAELVAQAERYCDDLPWVHFATADLPAGAPSGAFDLILFNRCLAARSEPDVVAAAEAAMSTLAPGGAIMLLHGTDPADERSAAQFIAACRPRLIPMPPRGDPLYRIDILRE